MSWLDELGPEGEALHKGLQAAQDRTGDELTRRRLWAQLAHVRPAKMKRRRWPKPVFGFAAAACIGALVYVTWPTGKGPVQMASNTPPAPVAQEAASRSPSFLQGPAVVRTGKDETMHVRLRGGARLALATQTQLVLSAQDAPEVKIGTVSLEVPKQEPGKHFHVVAGPFKVVVVGTRFTVSVRPESVGVEVQEGVVEVEREGGAVRLEAGQNWTGWLVAPPAQHGAAAATRVHPPVARLVPRTRSTGPVVVPSLEPQTSPPAVITTPPAAPSLAVQARNALKAGDTDRALALLQTLAAQSGPGSENAVYEMGRIWRDLKRQPRKALDVWRAYQFSHPAGLLRHEVDLSVIETFVALGDTSHALIEAEAFLAKYPRSERRSEVVRLKQLLLDRQAPAGP
ncbi:MAG: FecR domain-containing protein [Deltaproteobacteria bacterium]|nr:FecR domain-containing protein [Deltaproteobacteria bacterium]